MTIADTPTTFWPQVLKRSLVADRTLAVRLEKPPQFSFRPGQFVELTLIDPPQSDGQGNTRALSIASAPHEDTLLVATRLRESAFKRALGGIQPRTQVRLEGPFGNFVLHRTISRPAVFVAGGIGITPFRSMLLDAAHRQSPQQLILFYSNRRPEDSAFLEELTSLSRDHAPFTLVATMTELNRSHEPWDGETGLISASMIAKYLHGVSAPIYYVAGPPALVNGLRQALVAAGVDEDDLRTEDFSGY